MFPDVVNPIITGGTFNEYSSHVQAYHVHGATIGKSSVKKRR